MLLLGIALLLLASLLYQDAETHRALAWGLPAVLIFIGGLGIAAFQKTSAPLLAIGDASYSIYLAHLFPITVLDIIFNRIPMLEGSAMAAVVFLLISVIAALLIGHQAYRRIELPTERWARGLLARRRGDHFGQPVR
ncbi:hypothetical protein [Paracoccus shanxieyensis]|uniref:Acyltransferase family protein n=1 Tax=Paracoccus shanxieyensis TaxID=2675752 RepID=A0A6L6J259_9RHOB|nr:hypothetical protein [Paracoccus shanxieyensis]MTH65350.1 hypothetical protein [Paracoccus shanxieyensis]MTH88495.1 hypothetical protein [Paracoccus shanxieyensis]